MLTDAIVLASPENLGLRSLAITPPGDEDVVVDIAWSGISTGTEKLLWTGRMPPFPGMGYPLVPGYESVGRVTQAGAAAGVAIGTQVYVPGANCYGDVRGLFGGTARRLVTRGARVLPVPEHLGERAILMALAATAQHAISLPGGAVPDLIVGHGTLGRLIARLAVIAGGKPVVWEIDPARAGGALGYDVVDPADDDNRRYHAICDASGCGSLLDTLIARLAPGGEIVLAGFYSERLSFAFPTAFMREARLRAAAQWLEADLTLVRDLAAAGTLSLDGLITHREPAARADAAYRTAFGDTACLKMSLDWNA